MRPVWSGSISFGLVNIPVKLYTAVEDERLSFDLLHKKDNSPIRYARFCKKEEKEVPYEEIVKGYNYYEDQYVLVDDEDFQKADLKRSTTIEIINFSDLHEVPTIFFEKPYYLESVKGSEKSYNLLRLALQKSGKVGIAKFVMRNREHLVVLLPMKEFLVLNQIRFNSEIRTTEQLKHPEKENVSNEEIALALLLIEKMVKPFRIDEYKDTYSEVLEKLIIKKSRGEKITAAGKKTQPTSVEDLMKSLKESLKK